MEADHVAGMNRDRGGKRDSNRILSTCPVQRLRDSWRDAQRGSEPLLRRQARAWRSARQATSYPSHVPHRM